MKIGGVELKGPNIEILVLPRPDGDIVIKAQTIKNFKEFESMVNVPQPGGARTKDGFKKDYKAKSYLDAVEHYERQRYAYMVLKSLEPSEIEWEKTDLGDPSTYLGWEEELQEAGLSEIETNKITALVNDANSLNEVKLQAARDAFLLGLEVEESDTSGPQTEQENT
jgi:hypothetical protein